MTFRDMSARRLAEAQLNQAQKLEAIGQLAAGIAHEINTPTQYIGDNVRFLRDAFQEILKVVRASEGLLQAAPATAPQVEAFREARRSADLDYNLGEIPLAIAQSLDGVERVTKIVHSMKEFAHPDRSDKVAADLNRIVESTVTVCRNEWKYVAELKLELSPELAPVSCFPGDIGQVVLNLVVNAAHAIAAAVGDGSKGKGRITVTTRDLGDRVEVAVADTGTGIAEKHRARIFEPFFTTKEVGKGTGQGLAMAHRLVTQRHGGTIEFETEMGKGTTFRVRLPR